MNRTFSIEIICDNNIKPQVVEYNRSTVISIASLQLAILFGIKFHNIMCLIENGGIQKLRKIQHQKQIEGCWNLDGLLARYSRTTWPNSLSSTQGLLSSQLLYFTNDRHKSDVNLTLTEWKRRHISLFVLPPHTSQLTQPLDVDVICPMKGIYNKELPPLYIQQNPGYQNTKYQIVDLLLDHISGPCRLNLKLVINTNAQISHLPCGLSHLMDPTRWCGYWNKELGWYFDILR